MFRKYNRRRKLNNVMDAIGSNVITAVFVSAIWWAVTTERKMEEEQEKEKEAANQRSDQEVTK